MKVTTTDPQTTFQAGMPCGGVLCQFGHTLRNSARSSCGHVSQKGRKDGGDEWFSPSCQG